jgi:glycine/D-amino acid oxidase-like deaminating enzyme
VQAGLQKRPRRRRLRASEAARPGTASGGVSIEEMPSSIWFQTLAEDQRRLLSESDPLPGTADVAIIGAGMIGLAAAYYLSVSGVSNICVLDRGTALGEASGANAGGLWFGQQSPEMGPLAALSKASSVLYDELAAGLAADFDFRRTGLLELLPDEQAAAQAGAQVHAVRAAGFRAEAAGAADLRALEPALCEGLAGAIFYPDEGQLHPGKLGAALIRWLKERKVRFCFHHEVTRAGGRIETSAGALEAGVTIIAAGAWTPLVTRALGWAPPIKPMRGELLATVPQPPLLRHTILGPRYYYWQLSEGHVAGGGTVEDAGFARGVDPECIADIRAAMDSLLPAVRNAATACAWSGFRPYCEDSRPVIGNVPGCERIYVAAGHFKKGILLAPVTGRILADLITTGQTKLPADLVSPARFPRL